MPPTSSPLAVAVADLKKFASQLRKRPDLRVTKHELGKPLAPGLVAMLRERPEELPAELVDFYELMDGVHVEWEFLGGDGHGGIRIPAWSGYTVFENDEKYANSFGRGKLSLLADAIAGEYGTWYVAKGQAGRAGAELRFAFQGEGDKGFVVAGSLAEYLQRAVAAGLANLWPIADQNEGVAEVVARINAPAVKPAKISPGVRVHSPYFAEGCRGEVLKLHTLEAPTKLGEFLRAEAGEQLALVRLDLGLTYWMYVKHLKAVPKKPDLYEQLHADPTLLRHWGQTLGWEEALRRLTILLGPLTAYSPGRAGNSRVAAALLQALPAAEAAALVRDLMMGIAPVYGTLPPAVEPNAEERKQVFDAYDWRRYSWQATWEGTLITLVVGLVQRLRLDTPEARATVPFATIEELMLADPTNRLRSYAIELKKLIVNEHDAEERDDYQPPISRALPDRYPVAYGSGM